MGQPPATATLFCLISAGRVVSSSRFLGLGDLRKHCSVCFCHPHLPWDGILLPIEETFWISPRWFEYLLLMIMSRFDEASKPCSDRARGGWFVVRQPTGSRQSRKRNHCGPT